MFVYPLLKKGGGWQNKPSTGQKTKETQCLSPALITHTRFSGMSFMTGWSMIHSIQLIVWTIVETISRRSKLHCNFLRPLGGLSIAALVHWMDGL